MDSVWPAVVGGRGAGAMAPGPTCGRLRTVVSAPPGHAAREPGPGRAARAGCHCVTSQAGGRGSEQPGGVEGLLPLLGPPSPISLSWPRAWQLLSAFSISSCEAVDGRRGGGAAQRERRAMSWARPGPPWSVTRGRGCLGLGPAQCARQQLLGPGWTHGDSPSPWGGREAPPALLGPQELGAKVPSPSAPVSTISSNPAGPPAAPWGLPSFPSPRVVAATQRPWPGAQGTGCHVCNRAWARPPRDPGASASLQTERLPRLELPPLPRGRGRGWPHGRDRKHTPGPPDA